MKIYQSRYVDYRYPEDSSDLGACSTLEAAQALAQAYSDERRWEYELGPIALEWNEQHGGVVVSGTTPDSPEWAEDTWYEIVISELI